MIKGIGFLASLVLLFFLIIVLCQTCGIKTTFFLDQPENQKPAFNIKEFKSLNLQDYLGVTPKRDEGIEQNIDVTHAKKTMTVKIKTREETLGIFLFHKFFSDQQPS